MEVERQAHLVDMQPEVEACCRQIRCQSRRPPQASCGARACAASHDVEATLAFVGGGDGWGEEEREGVNEGQGRAGQWETYSEGSSHQVKIG